MINCNRTVYDWDNPGKVKEISLDPSEHVFAYSGATPCTGEKKCIFCGLPEEGEEDA